MKVKDCKPQFDPDSMKSTKISVVATDPFSRVKDIKREYSNKENKENEGNNQTKRTRKDQILSKYHLIL